MAEVPNRFDHLVFGGGRPLDALAEGFAEQAGVTPAVGGRHAKLGTHNALAGLGHRRYLEFLAVDPAGGAQSGVARLLATERPRILAWAIAVPDLDAAVRRARQAGYDPGPPEPLERRRPDGTVLAWRLAWRGAGVWSGIIPFLIDWQDCPHPATASPTGCALETFHAEHPRPDAVVAQLAALEVDLRVREGPAPRLVAHLATPCGAIVLR